MIVIVVDDEGASGGGSDVTPAAVNWANITVSDTTTGYESNAAQTITGIDTVIQLRAAWTSTSSSPAYGQWFKNGVAVQAVTATPVDVSVSVNDALYFALYAGYTSPAGNYDTGTVTVTNQSDGGATLDTFTFVVQYVAGSGGSGGGGDAPRFPPAGGDKEPV